MKTHHAKLRALLRANPDGLTAKQLENAINQPADTISQSLKTMPDAYVDRWQGPYRGQYAAVWCVVVPPPNCPKPER